VLAARRCVGSTALAAGLWLCAAAALAQQAPPAPDPEGPLFPVSQFRIQYRSQHPDHPPLDRVMPLEVELGQGASGLTAPRPGQEIETVQIDPEAAGETRLYHASALGRINEVLLDRFRSAGLVGVYVAPHEADIDIETERDLRREGDTILRLVVSTGRVRRVRTLASGGRIRSDWRIDNTIHRRIRANSPLQPSGALEEDETDLLLKDRLEDYLFQLNRYPGRRVEAALAASEDGEGVDLDYHVYESKPWFVYFQSSNTGTEQTAKWQNRVGYVNRQLTNRDDVLAVEYMNGGLDRVHAVRASYESPWFRGDRPKWMRRSGLEPSWMAWLNRDKIPWWGVDRLRWRVEGAWTQFKARDVDFTEDFKGQDWNVAGELIYTLFQHRAFFLDSFLAFELRNVETDNTTSGTTESTFLFQPEIGVRFDRVNEFSNLFGQVSFEYAFASDDQQELALLGRADPNSRWPLLQWDISGSHYLEPLLFPKAWRDPSGQFTSTLAHELVLRTRGQYSFGKRLIPQTSQVIGGLYSVRGYPQSEAVGDDVYTGTVEYLFHIPRALPVLRKPVRIPLIGDFRFLRQQVYGRPDWDLIFRAFFDAGYTALNKGGAGGPIGTSQTLLGAGVGAELRIKQNIRARVDWGRALKSTKCPRTASGVPLACEQTRAGHSELYFLFNVLY